MPALVENVSKILVTPGENTAKTAEQFEDVLLGIRERSSHAVFAVESANTGLLKSRFEARF